MNLDRLTEHVYIALSHKWCHTKLMTKSHPNPIILSKHRFKVYFDVAVDSYTYSFHLRIHAPDIDKAWHVDKVISGEQVDFLNYPNILLDILLKYFDSVLSEIFVRVEDTEITRQLYDV